MGAVRPRYRRLRHRPYLNVLELRLGVRQVGRAVDRLVDVPQAAGKLIPVRGSHLPGGGKVPSDDLRG